jgi:hypothetical protein
MAGSYFNLPQITQLTISQQTALNEIKQIALSGGPGTGKSVVSLWWHISNYQRGKKSLLLTYMICFHYGSFRNLKHFYLFYVAKHLQSEFPNLLSYNRFVELERKVMLPFALFLKLICFRQCTGITFIDSTKCEKHMLKFFNSLHRTQVVNIFSNSVSCSKSEVV